MTLMLRVPAVVLAAFGLSACFTSPKALIAPAEAEFPLAAPTTVERLRADGTAEKLRLEKQNGAYVLIDPEGGKDKKDQVKHVFVVRGIGDGLYVVQRFGDNAVCPCTFGLIAMKDGVVSLHNFEGFGEAPQLSGEEMARYGVTVETSNYQLSSFDKTAALFSLLLERPRPDEVYKVK